MLRNSLKVYHTLYMYSMATTNREVSALEYENPNNFYTFHHRCGRRITLSNGNRTATRSVLDFSHALVFSSKPLEDGVLFEVLIDRKNNSWGGSIEIGVTSESPDKLEMPSCATALRNGSWVMSGIDVRKDGVCIMEFYGTDLESLEEGDRVGVMRSINGELVFFVNGEPQGIAAKNMPKRLWALVDLYGRCVQVSLYPSSQTQEQSSTQLHQNTTISSSLPSICPSETGSSSINLPENLVCNDNNFHYIHNYNANNNGNNSVFDIPDRLRFHTRCGSLVKLSANFRTAERHRPLDEFNNGVVMTHRPLRNNELFEIRIDKLVEKWSGSIEVGVTTHNPAMLHFPATMTNMRSGTIMMSGCGILTNGKGTRRQYGEFNLDELREGDRVGMMRKPNGNLHYFINGQDQGIAAVRVATTMWGVIDLYGMTIKVSIVDEYDRDQQNLLTRMSSHQISGTEISAIMDTGPSAMPVNNHTTNFLQSSTPALLDTLNPTPMSMDHQRGDGNALTFHPLCGSHASVMHNGRTAIRPNASEDFNNGVVLTSRPLRTNELFQVRLERIVTKWAGSIELGVTIYSAEELEFPFTMTNVRTGTWMMTGNGVMHNGLTVIEQYGQNLDRLQVGDRVGVMRKDDGTLHFFVNDIDQGAAASNIPKRVFGVVDLYGQAAQASIVGSTEMVSPDTDNSTISNTTLYSEPALRFHTIHGKNAVISNNGLTASRPNSLAEFNDGLLFSNRCLRQRELFEVVLETMVRHWSGNIEIGVTGTRPEDMQLAPNATDLNAFNTIILCGSMIFYNRKTIKSNIGVDLDSLGAGSRVGVMRNGDFIHFFVDGVDQGPSVQCRSPNVWAVVDLYGQCAQVSITPTHQPDVQAPYAISENSQSCQGNSIIQIMSLETKHRWTNVTNNVSLTQNWTMASRMTGNDASLRSCVIFSEYPLTVGSPFEFVILSHASHFARCLSLGVTNLNLTDDNVRKHIPLSIGRIPSNVWYVRGNKIRHNSNVLQTCSSSLEWLRVGDRITIELTRSREVRVYLNSEFANVSFADMPKDVYVIVELKGATVAVQALSVQGIVSPLRPSTLRLQDSLDFDAEAFNKQDSILESLYSDTASNEFSSIHGQNIVLLDGDRCAIRARSYSHGIVFVNKPLGKGESISIKIEQINVVWRGTIGIGIAGTYLKDCCTKGLPQSILHFKRQCWLVTHDFVNVNGYKISTKYAEALEQIRTGSIITITLTTKGSLSITVDSTTFTDLGEHINLPVLPVFDLYGKCEKISIVPLAQENNDNNVHNKFVAEAIDA